MSVVMLFYSLLILSFPSLYCFAQVNSSTTDVLKAWDVVALSLGGYDAAAAKPGQPRDAEVRLGPGAGVVLSVRDVPADGTVAYLLLQVHAHLGTVTLASEGVPESVAAVGADVGLVVPAKNGARFYISSSRTYAMWVLVAVQGYGRDAPVPGGCNMEAPLEVTPYLGVGYDVAVVQVDVPPPSGPAGRGQCETQRDVDSRVYVARMREGDTTREAHFAALRRLMTVAGMREDAVEVEWALRGPRARRFFAPYPGIGTVFGAVTTYGGSAASYVPAVTYACNVSADTGTCDELLESPLSKVVCAATIFVGLFVCFYGHRFFQTTLFLVGVLVGALFCVMLSPGLGQRDVNVTYCVMGGLVFGAVWLSLWYCSGNPFLAVLPATLTLGFVVASVVMYAGVGDYSMFESDLNFWLLVLCITVSMPSLLSFDGRLAFVACCSVLGSLAVVVPLDRYVGSAVRFAFVNVVKRALYADFATAYLGPPFQVMDLVLCAVWLILALLGIAFQWVQSRGKPPFPAPHFWRDLTQHPTPMDNCNDRSPLLWTGPPQFVYCTDVDPPSAPTLTC